MHHHPDALHHHQPPYHIAGTHVARVTNYGPGTGRNADGTSYSAGRIAADWGCYRPGTRIAFWFPAGRVVATVHDRGGAVRGGSHFDWPRSQFCRLTGLTSRGTAYVRFRVLYRPDGRPVIRVGRGRSLETFRRAAGLRRRHYRRAHRWHRLIARPDYRPPRHHRHNRYGRSFHWDRELHREHFRRTERVRLVHRHRRHHHHHRHHSHASRHHRSHS